MTAKLKLVPVEPTEAMIEAARDVKRRRLLRAVEDTKAGREPNLMGATMACAEEWAAMLASAPAAPEQAVPLTDEQSIQITRLRAEAEALRKDAERLRIRSDAYEMAYGIAYQATYQSHNGHWDSTMRGGLGCPECIRAREARENCDAALKEGLQKLIAIAATKEQQA